MIIEVYADVLCGWAYIGKRRLERALRSLDRPATVLWRPFLIDPTAPQWSTSLTAVLAEPGVAEEVAACGPGSVDEGRGRIREAAREEGIDGDFGARWRASSWGAHRLITAALRHGPEVQDRLVEELFRSHLVEQTDVNALDRLTGLADRYELPRPPGADALNAGLVYLEPGFDPADPVERATREALLTGRAIGVATSPTFVINGRVAVAGAQSPEVLAEAIAAAPPAEPMPAEVRRLRLAEALLDRRDPHGSRYLLQPLLTDHPDDPNVRSLHARVQAATASLAPAAGSLAALVAEHPDDAYLRELYGRTLRRLGDHERGAAGARAGHRPGRLSGRSVHPERRLRR